METAICIDSQATHDKVRSKFGSIPAFCREIEVSPRTYYFAVKGDRGQTRSKSDAKRVLEALEQQGLLVKSIN